jgi:hypothetical protein
VVDPPATAGGTDRIQQRFPNIDHEQVCLRVRRRAVIAVSSRFTARRLVQPSEETVLEFYLDTVSTTCGSGWVNDPYSKLQKRKGSLQPPPPIVSSRSVYEPQRRLTPSKKPDTFKTYLDNSPVSPH